MRNGDFSELLALGPQYQIYNPFTRRAIGNGRFQQDPFPGNIIPQNLINPVARAALQYMAHPLTPGQANGTANFQNPSLAEVIKYANNTIRRPQPDRQAAHGWPRELGMIATATTTTTSTTSRPASGSSCVAPGRARPRLRAQPEHRHERPHGYNWFVRGTDSNPANHDFDLTSLGFPARITRRFRRHPAVPAIRHHRLSRHRHRRRRASERDPRIRHAEQEHGIPCDPDRHGVPAIL
jgi:hypothetical protein